MHILRINCRVRPCRYGRSFHACREIECTCKHAFSIRRMQIQELNHDPQLRSSSPDQQPCMTRIRHCYLSFGRAMAQPKTLPVHCTSQRAQWHSLRSSFEWQQYQGNRMSHRKKSLRQEMLCSLGICQSPFLHSLRSIYLRRSASIRSEREYLDIDC
jgi:hypothetical protein